MEQKLFEQSVEPFKAWAKEDEKHRAVIILAYDDSQDTCLHTDECVIGCKSVLVPAVAHTKIGNKDSLAGEIMRESAKIIAIRSLVALYGIGKEGKDESHDTETCKP